LFCGLPTIIISKGYLLKVEGLVVGADTDRWLNCALLLLFLLFPCSLRVSVCCIFNGEEVVLVTSFEE
jgi:hypothetical protein